MRYLEKVIPYKRETDDIKISGLGDMHIGNAGVDYPALDRSIKFILDNDCYVVGMGDYIEGILPNDPRFCMSAADKRLSYYNIIDNELDYVIEKLSVIPNDRWIVMLSVSEDTLVLTENGWKKYTDLSIGEQVLSLNTETNTLEYTPIYGIFPKYYKGKMINLKSNNQDQLITPDHRVLLYNDSMLFQYTKAENLPQHSIRIPVARLYLDGNNNKLTDDEIRLVAWIIAEGHFRKEEGGSIEITQSCKSSYLQEIKELLNRMQIHFTVCHHKGRGTRVHETDWETLCIRYNAIQWCVKLLKERKEIPRSLLDLPYKQLNILFRTLIKGDGSQTPNGGISYYSANEQLALQFLELTLKLGHAATMHKRERRQQYKGYHRYVRTVGFIVYVHEVSNKYISGPYEHLDYEGNVFCLSTGNGNFMAMRNGRPFLTGNTGNHEETVRRKYYREVTESQICKRLNIPYGSYSCYVRLVFRRGRHSEVLKLYANHGYGNARFPPTKLWKLIHAREGRDVDLLMMGHVHELAIYTGKMNSISSRGRPKAIERPIGAMLTGHFIKGEVEGVDQYTEKFAASPSKTGIGTFTIRPEQHKIHGGC